MKRGYLLALALFAIPAAGHAQYSSTCFYATGCPGASQSESDLAAGQMEQQRLQDRIQRLEWQQQQEQQSRAFEQSMDQFRR